MHYITTEECLPLFKIALEFNKAEDTPDYGLNSRGIEKLDAVLKQSRSSWYKGVYEKATYIFLSINKGHFFINGNKRLALIITLYFLYQNGKVHKKKTLVEYQSWFKEKFPEYNFEHEEFREAHALGFYNFNIAIAASHEHFDTLKKKVKNFLETFMM